MTLCSETFLPTFLMFYLSFLLLERKLKHHCLLWAVMHFNKRELLIVNSGSQFLHSALSQQIPCMRLLTTGSTSPFLKKWLFIRDLRGVRLDSEPSPASHSQVFCIIYDTDPSVLSSLCLHLSLASILALDGCLRWSSRLIEEVANTEPRPQKCSLLLTQKQWTEIS